MDAPEMPTPVKSGHVEANGVRYYYAIYGRGEPCCCSTAVWARSRCSDRI